MKPFVVVAPVPRRAIRKHRTNERQQRRTVHRGDCRHARWARYRIDTAEVVRMEARATRGDDDGRTNFCHYCRPLRLAALIVDAT